MSAKDTIWGRILGLAGNTQPMLKTDIVQLFNPVPDLSGITEVKVTLTAAQLKTLNGTPVALIPAQGAGTAIQVISAAARLNYGGVVFDNGHHITLSADGDGTFQFQCTDILNSENSNLWLFVPPVYNDILETALIENSPIYAHDPVGTDSTTGNSTIDIYLSYKVITL